MQPVWTDASEKAFNNLLLPHVVEGLLAYGAPNRGGAKLGTNLNEALHRELRRWLGESIGKLSYDMLNALLQCFQYVYNRKRLLNLHLAQAKQGDPQDGDDNNDAVDAQPQLKRMRRIVVAAFNLKAAFSGPGTPILRLSYKWNSLCFFNRDAIRLYFQRTTYNDMLAMARDLGSLTWLNTREGKRKNVTQAQADFVAHLRTLHEVDIRATSKLVHKYYLDNKRDGISKNRIWQWLHALAFEANRRAAE